MGKYVVDRRPELIDDRLLFNWTTLVLSTYTFTTHMKGGGGKVSTPSWYWEVQVSNYVSVLVPGSPGIKLRLRLGTGKSRYQITSPSWYWEVQVSNYVSVLVLGSPGIKLRLRLGTGKSRYQITYVDVLGDPHLYPGC